MSLPNQTMFFRSLTSTVPQELKPHLNKVVPTPEMTIRHSLNTVVLSVAFLMTLSVWLVVLFLLPVRNEALTVASWIFLIAVAAVFSWLYFYGEYCDRLVNRILVARQLHSGRWRDVVVTDRAYSYQLLSRVADGVLTDDEWWAIARLLLADKENVFADKLLMRYQTGMSLDTVDVIKLKLTIVRSLLTLDLGPTIHTRLAQEDHDLMTDLNQSIYDSRRQLKALEAEANRLKADRVN